MSTGETVGGDYRAAWEALRGKVERERDGYAGRGTNKEGRTIAAALSGAYGGVARWMDALEPRVAAGERSAGETRVGDRVEMVSCADPFTRLRPGARGTVRRIDVAGTVHVAWDDGHSLGLVDGEDEWRVVVPVDGAA